MCRAKSDSNINDQSLSFGEKDLSSLQSSECILKTDQTGQMPCQSHYENMSVHYEAISKSGKNDIFKCKNVTFFLIFAQNIDCGYTLEPREK